MRDPKIPLEGVASDGELAMAVKCPTCSKPAEKPHSPFCSRRCAQADLGRWFSGQYGVPAAEEPDSADLEALEKAVLEAMEDGTVIKGSFGGDQ